MIFGMYGNGGCGDTLWITPALQYYKDKGEKCIVEFHDDAQSRWVSPILNGLAEVQHIENPRKRLYEGSMEPTHYAQTILNKLNIKDINCIPKIIIKKSELKWAKKFLSSYNNPIAVHSDNSGCRDPRNTRARYVCPPEDVMQASVDFLKNNGYTLLQFGREDTPRLNNVEFITGLTIRQIAACFKAIGKIVAGDSGLYHLMLSVGGQALTFIPQESRQYGYIYDHLLYKPYLWKDEKIRVKYIPFYQLQARKPLALARG